MADTAGGYVARAGRAAEAILLACLLGAATPAAVGAVLPDNAGQIAADLDTPFTVHTVAQFDYPWALAFLPDGRMLVTEKPGNLFIVTQDGQKTPVTGIPKVFYSGQNGLLDVALAPDFPKTGHIYFTYVAPVTGGGVLVLARARLQISGTHATLLDEQTIWQQQRASRGGQPGGIIAFAPDEQKLFLTVGDRQEPETAQNPDLARGKILRMNLDGTTPVDNPQVGQKGIRALTWTTGHRNPYGLAFAPDGQLWEHEMGPRGGDELNLIQPGQNYGWAVVSYGDQYSGRAIPRPPTHPEFQEPALYWTPVISPAGLVFYHGALFPQWDGSMLIGGLGSRSLIRVHVDPDLTAYQVDRWTLGRRIRDVAVAPDGAVWLIEDSGTGHLMRLTPK